MNGLREITIKDSTLTELLNLLLSSLNENESSVQKFVFDDEPLDAILYGDTETGSPTVANLFLTPVAYVDAIKKLNADGQTHEVIGMASELAVKDCPLSLKICYEMVRILAPLIPQYPKPLLSYNITVLGPLLEKIWNTANEKNEGMLQEAAGQIIYRWYEHHQRFKEARRTIAVLMNVILEKGEPTGIAVLTNNYGFEFALEGRWQEAMPYFQQAAEIFGKNNDEMNNANARANFFMSKVECGEFLFVEQHIEELTNLNEKLENAGPWQKRKPLIILARMEEHRGNTQEAIRFAEKAIEADRKGDTKYSEEDNIYLSSLIEKVQGSLI